MTPAEVCSATARMAHALRKLAGADGIRRINEKQTALIRAASFLNLATAELVLWSYGELEPSSDEEDGDPEIELVALRNRIARNAGTGRKRAPLWTHVCAVTAYGSTKAKQLCKDAGLDPNEEVGNSSGEWQS